jgi:hypothetical protein
VNLEGAVRGRKHSRDHPAYTLRFGHLAKPYTEAEAEGNLPWDQQGLRSSWQEALIGSAAADEGLPSISICPRCGARLVTRNLWHSCGTFTLEGLFPRSEPAVLDLARSYVVMLYTLGDVQVIPQKTRLTCVARVRFAGLQPRKDGFLASFALHRWLDPNSTAHHVL